MQVFELFMKKPFKNILRQVLTPYNSKSIAWLEILGMTFLSRNLNNFWFYFEPNNFRLRDGVAPIALRSNQSVAGE